MAPFEKYTAAHAEISTRCKRTIHVATTMNSQVLGQNRAAGTVDRRSVRMAHDSPAAWITTQTAIRQQATNSLVSIVASTLRHPFVPVSQQGAYPSPPGTGSETGSLVVEDFGGFRRRGVRSRRRPSASAPSASAPASGA